MNTIAQELARIGAIQFGQFETKPGQFQPFSIRLRLLPSYPAILNRLAQEIAPLVKVEGLTHLLTMPAATPLGVAVSLINNMPLVYPAPDDPNHVEGAYDYNVPTVLLTDVFTDGKAEQEMISHVEKLGLDVEVVVAVIDLNKSPDLPLTTWRSFSALMNELPTVTPSMRMAVETWIKEHLWTA